MYIYNKKNTTIYKNYFKQKNKQLKINKTIKLVKKIKATDFEICCTIKENKTNFIKFITQLRKRNMKVSKVHSDNCLIKQKLVLINVPTIQTLQKMLK